MKSFIAVRCPILGPSCCRNTSTWNTSSLFTPTHSAAEETARRILREAGCDADRMITTPMRGTHPSATVRIGDVLSADLSTSVEGLYVCDASVFPEALARPTVLTIIALAKRLAATLIA